MALASPMSVVLAEAVLLVLEAEAVPVLPVLPVLELPEAAVPFHSASLSRLRICLLYTSVYYGSREGFLATGAGQIYSGRGNRPC